MDILNTCEDLYKLIPCPETMEFGKRLSSVETSNGLRYSECSSFEFMKLMNLPSLKSQYMINHKKIDRKWSYDVLCSICHEVLTEKETHKKISCNCRTRIIHEKCMGNASIKKCPCCEINLIIKDIKNVI